MKINKEKIKKEMEKGDFVLAVVTATKPDFYKQAPVIRSAREKNFPCFVINTGQHYDDLLGHGLEEYGISKEIGADLKIRGDLSEKTSEIMLKTKKLAKYLKENYKDKTVLPLVHGDTLAAGVFPQAWMFATNQRAAHNEAGLRGMAPDYENHENISQFIHDQFNNDWDIDRNEPFPEQYDTFIGSPACEYHFAPTELNKKHLIREGYPEEVNGDKKIEVVGNSVVDAIELKKKEKLEKSVFDIYPILEKRNDWIRVDFHRRANLLPNRFKAIIRGVIKLVKQGYNINFIEMTANKKALEHYGLREKLKKLNKENKNFLMTDLWKKHAHVYEFLESGQAFAELTDSGSMQEELNHIRETLSLTARFNTDRPETVFKANSNLLVPPLDGDYITRFVNKVYNNSDLVNKMKQAEKMYGENVGESIIDFLREKKRKKPFVWSHEKAGFETEADKDFEYL